MVRLRSKPIRRRNIKSAFEKAQDYIQMGHLDGLKELLSDYPKLAIYTTLPDLAGHRFNLLHLLAMSDPAIPPLQVTQLAKCLLDHGTPINTPTKTPIGPTALHLAIQQHQLPLVEFLIHQKASLELRGIPATPFSTPLGYTLFYGSTPIAHALHYAGATMHLPFAAALGKNTLLQGQFFHPILSPDQLTLDYSLLFAAYTQQLSTCHLLLQQNANPTRCLPFFTHHANALHLACLAEDYPELILLLLDHGADPNVVDCLQGQSALGWAMERGRVGSFEGMRGAK
ncbi:MAG: ankyrin repeat domain-containing protein [Bacteroidota bacterium]